MVISFIKNYWIILAFLPAFISSFIAFRNFWQKSHMSITITLAIGLGISHLLLSLSLFWYMSIDFLSFLCVFGFGLIFIMVSVLISWINDQLFGDFCREQNFSALFTFEKKRSKRESQLTKENKRP